MDQHGSERTGPQIDYGALYDFAQSFCVDYNYLCKVVREAVAAPTPTPQWTCNRCGAIHGRLGPKPPRSAP
jgi:hypothetical protein